MNSLFLLLSYVKRARWCQGDHKRPFCSGVCIFVQFWRFVESEENPRGCICVSLRKWKVPENHPVDKLFPSGCAMSWTERCFAQRTLPPALPLHGGNWRYNSDWLCLAPWLPLFLSRERFTLQFSPAKRTSRTKGPTRALFDSISIRLPRSDITRALFGSMTGQMLFIASVGVTEIQRKVVFRFYRGRHQTLMTNLLWETLIWVFASWVALLCNAVLNLYSVVFSLTLFSGLFSGE